MRKILQSCALILGLFLVLAAFSPALPVQAKADNGKVIGLWKIAVDANTEYYYLVLEIKEAEGKLTGAISETQGTFTDLPVGNLVFDGENLTFEFTCPTPPDGLERLVKAEFKVGVDSLEGTMSVPDIEASAPASGSREKN
jgi:hypothetical protein